MRFNFVVQKMNYKEMPDFVKWGLELDVDEVFFTKILNWGTYTDEEFKELSAKYTHAKPFTKESLLYREIFEKFYPGQGEMIVDFWMPNKEWEGCDVNDPSARVLSNYGDSGK